MRLAGVSTRDEANDFLPGFIARHNARFARPARDPESAWRTLPEGFDFDYTFATRAGRLIKRDHTVQWRGRCLQIKPEQGAPSIANKRIAVHVSPEGNVALHAGRHRLRYRVLEVSGKQSRLAANPSVTAAKPVEPKVKAATQARRRGWLFTKHA